eukprot:TRINITY_DN7834_c0_g1_i1.p1 TRINITY_DN7834_c0_g1~~TRINITY_DN7834_c0_g1_i1.p1  ORF type:complete len:343 (-),score=53.93 TRINITY_DN7834_c0_g1_i1:10-1038(-)
MRRQHALRCALVRFVHGRCGITATPSSSSSSSAAPAVAEASATAATSAWLSANVVANRPAIVRGLWQPGFRDAASHVSSDAALGEDIIPRLREICGHRVVSVRLPALSNGSSSSSERGATYGDAASPSPYKRSERWELSRALDSLCGGCYIANVPLEGSLPELYDQLQPLVQKVDSLGGSSFGPAADGTPALYLGASGQQTPLHFDPTENLTIVLQGAKRIRLFAPSASPFLQPRGGRAAAALCWLNGVVPAVYSGLDAWSSEAPRAEAVDITLHAGDLLYIPAAWWHAVVGSEEPNVTVVFGYAPSASKGARYYSPGVRTDLLKYLPTVLAVGAAFWWTSG